MSQQHGDRLSALDASFLQHETASTHMHVGAALILDGPAPSYSDLCDHIRSRLHLVPRYRQKLATPPLQTGRPVWVDDPGFHLEYHVRHSALPSPGTEDQLAELAARIHSHGLDRSKPLWELWLVQGLEGNRFALLSKSHHALVDGVAGVDLATVLLDLTPVPVVSKHPSKPWIPQPEPTQLELAAHSLAEIAHTPGTLINKGIAAASNLERSGESLKETLQGFAEVAWAALNPAPATPLNVEIGPHRRFEFIRHDLDDFKLIKNTFGGTVNDVVIAVSAGALRRWLKSRSVNTDGLALRGLVPVSIRTNDERGAFGNRIAGMRATLPVYIADPVERLAHTRVEMDGVKDSKQAIAAEALTALENFAPPNLLAQASRINFSTRLFNLLVTNIPGPQIPLYILGRELRDLFPIAFLSDRQALAIAIMSYNGKINFGLLGDYDAMFDLDHFAEFTADEVEKLVTAAKKKAQKKKQTIRSSNAAQ